ncbi:MAG: hypothetical protein DWQ04_25905 [Chloroflexi bacterium]|nr:MAG: hypothetical protein DWQ04_25905 [Chloroflexota bacterium]
MESFQLRNSDSEQPFTIKLTLPAKNLLNDWKQCSMLANYIAEYVGYQYPQQERAENLISTITNELLETAVAIAPEQSDLTISLQQLNDGLQVQTNHGIRDDLASPYQDFLSSLSKNNIEGRYLKMLTAKETPERDFNQLGLLMITHDFGARLLNCSQESSNRICTQLFIADKEFQA